MASLKKRVHFHVPRRPSDEQEKEQDQTEQDTAGDRQSDEAGVQALQRGDDALEDLYDTAVLISADSDLTPCMEAIKKYFPSKKVLLFFPPKRSSMALRNACHIYCGVLNKTTISKSQLPETIISKTGYPLTRPEHWT